MSKICNRKYEANTIFTQKVINGVACCPLCEKPAVLHGKIIEARAMYWALSGDTGISSETLARHMTGIGNTGFRAGPPSDADDRGRCIRLLELIPEWIPRLPELAKDDKPQESIVINRSGMHTQTNGWAAQIPLIIKEGKL